jgi:tRNA threonylcarbamoyladenosine biosynthesis protein TsaB
MEVYAAFHKADGSIYREVKADIISQESYRDILATYQVCFFGNGAEKCKAALTHSNAHFIEDFHPSATHMIAPAYLMFQQKKFEDVAYFEPYYLKDFIATIPKKKVL